MQLDKFKGQKKEELSLIEVARAILEEKGETMGFADLVNAMQTFLGKSDLEIRDRLSQFYTDLNVNGAFISLGDNVWGLRSWYPFESVDEEVTHPDEEERPRRKKRKKVNAFLADVADDDDVIDYNDDDPEDDDSLDADYVDDEGVETDVHTDGADYNSSMVEVEADDDDTDEGLPDGIEGQLAEFGEDDDDELDGDDLVDPDEVKADDEDSDND